MQRPFPLRFLGANRREFRASLLIGLAGFVSTFFLGAWNFRIAEDNPRLVLSHLANTAVFFVVGLVALLCSINAFQDRSNTNDERSWILVWSVVLCLWVFLAGQGLVFWWKELPTVLKPTWLQNF